MSAAPTTFMVRVCSPGYHTGILFPGDVYPAILRAGFDRRVARKRRFFSALDIPTC